MIIDGHYYFNVIIQDHSDFLRPDDVIAFSMTEHCGAAGVMFELMFKTTSSEIADLIIENNQVIFQFGESLETAHSFPAYISEHPEKKSNADDSETLITLIATRIPMSFYTTRASETVHGISIDMIKKMAKTYLETDVDVQIDTPVEKECDWLRSYETGAVTMMEAWLHMNLPKNVPLLWIDTEKVVHVKDLEKIKSEGVKWTFSTSKDAMKNQLGYLNAFEPKSYKFDTNLITGKKTILNVSNIESGNDVVAVHDNKAEISSTVEVEEGEIGNQVLDNKYQTDNVHNKYIISYYTNKLRLIQLSSHIGELELQGYYPNVHICDLVDVTGCQQKYSGRYLVNTKIVAFGLNRPIKTKIAVCRDNTNSIEDSAITPKSQVTMTNQQFTDIMQSIRTLRRITIMGTKFLDGTTKGQIMGYCKSFKYNALNNFQVLGTPLNLNSSLEIMQSLKNIGIKLINNIIDKYIPYPFNLLLHDVVLQGFNFKRLMSQLFAKYLPSPLREFLMELLALLAALASLADALHKQNKKKLSNYEYTRGGYSANDNKSPTGNASGTPSEKDEDLPSGGENNMNDTTQENTESIKQITDEFLDNTDGLDIPIPDISLSESEALLPKDELKEVVAEKVVNYLEGQGYLTGVGAPAFMLILMGKKPLDFNTIKLINGNTGNMLYARYWGTYGGEITKLGRLEDIQNQVISIPHEDLTEELYGGDSVIISGTDSSNGTYTVTDVIYDKQKNMSYVSILEEIQEYKDTPLSTLTTLCAVKSVQHNQTVTVTRENTEVEIEGASILTISGRFNTFIKPDMNLNITGLGMDGNCTVYAVEYNSQAGETYVYTRTPIVDKLDGTKTLQVIVSAENGTSISKLSNHTFTEFYIKNGFKDIYSTVPCTKIVSALKGAKVWMALPNIVFDIDFYINSQKVEMDVIENIDLGLYAPGGAKLPYNVYMSKDTYNSNSVTLEVRRKV